MSAAAPVLPRVKSDHKPGVLQLALGLIIVIIIATLSLTSSQPDLPPIAEFAPQVNHVVANAPAEQQQGGVGSVVGRGTASATPSPTPTATPAAAVAAGSPTPRAQQGRLLHCVGSPPRQTEDPQSPPCVPSWTGDNGGATSRGVTADQITIMAPLPTFTSGGDGTEQPMMQAFERFFNDRFEFYGRKIHLVVVPAGQDSSPAAQQSWAVYADKQVGAFASTFYQYNGGSEFYPALAQHQVIGSMGDFEMQYDATELNRLNPYIWSYLMSADQEFANIGDWVCRRVAGQLAANAPDPTIAAKPRTFGVLYEPTTTQDPLNEPDLGPLLSALHGCNADPVAVYKGSDWGQILTMQAKGVTSVICLCNWIPMEGMQTDAQAHGYLPEWLLSSFEINDYNFTMKFGANQGQPAPIQGAFGLAFRPRQVRPTDEPFYKALVEQGYTDSTSQDLVHVWERREFYRSLLLLASGIQLAGPNLTPETFAAGLHRAVFPNPPSPDQPGKVGLAGASHSMTLDGAEWWWSQTAKSPYPGDTAGSFCYIDGGARHTLGTWPQGGNPFFTGSCDSGFP